MLRRYLLPLILVAWCAQAQAAEPIFTLDYVLELYRHEFGQLQQRIVDFCRNLLFYLASIAIVATGIKLILLQDDVKFFCYNLVRLMFTVGAVYFLIFNGPAISTDIVNSLVSLALDRPMSSAQDEPFDGVTQLFILSDFLSQSEMIRDLMGQELGFSLASLLTGLCFVLIHALVTFLTLIFAVTYLNAYFNAICGVLVVALGVFSFTRSISLQYLFHTLAYGLKLFTLCIIYTVGARILEGIMIDFKALEAAHATVSLQYLGLLVSIIFFILGLALAMPNMVASLVSDTCNTYSMSLYPNLHRMLKI